MIEKDGPPQAYFDLEGERIYYKQVMWRSRDESSLLAVRDIFFKELTAATEKLSATVWWRIRPEHDHTLDGWKFYARLATTPALNDEFWKRWEITDWDNMPQVILYHDPDQTRESRLAISRSKRHSNPLEFLS